MITELTIRNLAVIEHVTVSFRNGFSVLTGETGAGKSIIIDALSLIAGGRGSAELIRYGCEKAEIEAQFDIPPGHPAYEALAKIGIETVGDEHLIIRREVSSQGKSTSRINGQLVNLTMLREVGEWLVNIHGQHEHQSLMKTEAHLHWLDLFDSERIVPVRLQYEQSYDRYTELRKELRHLEETSKQALQMADLYRFQIEEIGAASLKIGEDESLSEEKRKLSNAEKLFQNVADSYDVLYGSKGLSAIAKAIQRVGDVAGVDSAKLNPLLEQMQSAYYQLEDAAFQLRDYRDGIEFNPARLEQIEDRLSLIGSLRRKYGDDVGEMIAYAQRIQQELLLIENKDETIKRIERDLEREKEALIGVGSKLSKLRQDAAKLLAKGIEAELKALHMERTRFDVSFRRSDDLDAGGTAHLSRNGLDEAEFLISPNPGEPLRPLAKIASGGEMSRIMLAMKSIFARVDRIPVLVFDEVDTGVSGRAAQAIAEKMSELSRFCQVFSITHLPQVACMADSHYLIQKTVQGDRTFTSVEDVRDSDRVRELARMLGGVEVTETTMNHAREMIELADEKKMNTSA
ncbi:DNA repair protein RecN [Paenibacillus hemerocallicola]|jgi:DNA repair protein RecN (Recombination protein N)|uniref:DNA repair protein RecN n=1 Tax=Paenibacillus hemerocallicola TaxID=1172614 RepID=A0A5C4TEF7_9BACL|nr:DNA repair protein RecN [Paenibacillus hemerocallicola]TNJ67345.1 DNA repair protein RecN [Paenibacillus hemerocallicola]